MAEEGRYRDWARDVIRRAHCREGVCLQAVPGAGPRADDCYEGRIGPAVTAASRLPLSSAWSAGLAGEEAGDSVRGVAFERVGADVVRGRAVPGEHGATAAGCPAWGFPG
jgi:hypothetical protein